VSHAFDMDIGAMVSAGSFRAGLTVRNLLEPGFETDAGAVMVLHRQVRAGVAVTPGREALLHASEDGWIVAVDADLTRTPAIDGGRRMVAAGAERWLAGHRVGLRGGARLNTVGAARPVGAAGISVAVKRGVLIEAHAARGGQDADRGWGAGLRVGF
jgi:F plasmid transfer operon, TraF, protein